MSNERMFEVLQMMFDERARLIRTNQKLVAVLRQFITQKDIDTLQEKEE